MITNKQLKELGFTFVGRRSAYLDTANGRMILIGGVMSLGKTNISEMTDCPLWYLKQRIFRANYVEPPQRPSEVIDGVLHMYLNVGFCALPTHTDSIYTFSTLNP